MAKTQKSLPSTGATIGPASQLALAMTEVSQANSISIVMFNAAQAQQAGQQIEVAALGYVIAKMAASVGSQK